MLGPRGRNAVIEQKVWLADHHQGRRDRGQGNRAAEDARDTGAQWCGEVASQTSDVAGDGTTTATMLAEAIFREGVRTVAVRKPDVVEAWYREKPLTYPVL